MVCALTKEDEKSKTEALFSTVSHSTWDDALSWVDSRGSFHFEIGRRPTTYWFIPLKIVSLSQNCWLAWPLQLFPPVVCNFEKWGPIVFLRKATIMVANEDNFYFSQTTSPLCIFRRIVNDTGSRTRFLEGYLFWMTKPSTNKSQ